MQFPDKLYVTRDGGDGEDGLFLVDEDASNFLTYSGNPTRVATYALVEVREGYLTPEFQKVGNSTNHTEA